MSPCSPLTIASDCDKQNKYTYIDGLHNEILRPATGSVDQARITGTTANDIRWSQKGVLSQSVQAAIDLEVERHNYIYIYKLNKYHRNCS